MNTTTITLSEETRDALRRLRDERDFQHYDATVTWLVQEATGE